MAIAIGTSGWSYDHWQGVLYPHGTAVHDRLAHYVPHFGTVELNRSFYRWPAERTFASWRRRLPPGFLLTVKAPRALTHGARLFRPERWTQRVVRSVARLHDRLGVLLVQLPPDLAADLPRLDYFLGQLPPDLRVAVEFRHPSWHREETFRRLEQAGVAYCVMSGAGLPCVLRATAPFVYVRLHGPDPEHLYAGAYSDADLHWWADRVRDWQAQHHDVFAYFNNDGQGHAVRNALALRALLQV